MNTKTDSKPTIEEAKKLAKKHGRDVLIVFSIGPDGRLHYASYGKDRRHCNVAQHLADRGFMAIQDAMQTQEEEATPGYRIVHQMYGAIVYGEIPQNKLAKVQEYLEKHRGLNIIDEQIAKELGATMVFTTNEKHMIWRADLGISDSQNLERVSID